MIPAILGVLASYLLGSVPTAFVLVKWVRRVDVRTIGSGNVGATNAARAAGKGIGIAVFCLDAAKGILAARLVAPWTAPSAEPAFQLGCGLAAVVGHCFPVFLRFRGGKGVATAFGVLLAILPITMLLCGLTWLAVVALTRYVSLGSLAAMAVLPFVQWGLHRSAAERLLGAALALLIIARHHTNIARLARGTEHRLGGSRRSSSRGS